MSSDRAVVVAVVGLGRMGTAIADRLADRVAVRTWSRSGGGTAPTAADAVADADVVLVCVYDGASCAAVLSACLPSAPPGARVVVIATVAPQEAAELQALVIKHGARYLHAPVLGSSPAAATGDLTVLTGGRLDDVCANVLNLLGRTLDLRTTSEAAATKLVANGVLGDGLLALRRATVRAEALGLDHDTILAVLGHTLVGPLVDTKRELLREQPDDAGSRPATFTAGALAKDLALLAEELGTVPHAAADLHTLLAAGAISPADDVATLVTARVDEPDLSDARLDVSPDIVADPHALVPLHAYALGHATGDPAHFRRAFRPTAHVEGVRDDRFLSWDLDAYCAMFTGAPAPDEALRRRRLETLDVRGGVATATMTLRHGPDTFTDIFVLLRDDLGGWRITNKAYQRLPTT